MRRNKFKATIILAIVAIFMGTNVYHNVQSTKKISDLALNNVEALAFWENVTDWWDSNTHTCQQVTVWEYKCMKYKDIPRENGGWEVDFGKFNPNEEVCGYFQVQKIDCVSGNSVAHCWEC